MYIHVPWDLADQIRLFWTILKQNIRYQNKAMERELLVMDTYLAPGFIRNHVDLFSANWVPSSIGATVEV